MSSFLSFVRVFVMVSLVSVPALAAAGSPPPASQAAIAQARVDSTRAPAVAVPMNPLDDHSGFGLMLGGLTAFAALPLIMATPVPEIVVTTIFIGSVGSMSVGWVWNLFATLSHRPGPATPGSIGTNVQRTAATTGAIVVRDSAAGANAGMHH